MCAVIGRDEIGAELALTRKRLAECFSWIILVVPDQMSWDFPLAMLAIQAQHGQFFIAATGMPVEHETQN